MRLLHATVIARYHSASVLAGFEPDACGVSRLVCQCQFKHGDDSVGMETHSRVSERLRQNSLLNCKAALGFSVGALYLHNWLQRIAARHTKTQQESTKNRSFTRISHLGLTLLIHKIALVKKLSKKICKQSQRFPTFLCKSL